MNKRGGIWVKEVERFEQVHLIEYTQSSCGPSFLLQLNSASQACLFPFNQLTLLCIHWNLEFIQARSHYFQTLLSSMRKQQPCFQCNSTPVHSWFTTMHGAELLMMNLLITVKIQTLKSFKGGLICLHVRGVSTWWSEPWVWRSKRRTSLPARNFMYCSRASLGCARSLGIRLASNKYITAAGNSCSSPWGSTWSAQKSGVG